MHEAVYYTDFKDIFGNDWRIEIALAGLLVWNPTEYNYGQIDIPILKTFVLTNQSTEQEAIVDISIIGDRFEIVNLYDMSGIVLQPGESIDVVVEFDGLVAGAYTGILRATSGGVNYDAELVGTWLLDEQYDTGS
jgi:hypothetical protein